MVYYQNFHAVHRKALFCFRKSTLQIIRAFLPLCSRYPCICENKACTQPGLVITHDETLTQLFFLCYKLVEIFLHLLWCFLAIEDLSDWVENKTITRFVPGRPRTEDFCSCPCPGTKGQRDKEIFLSLDKGTTGRPVRDCPCLVLEH